MTAPFPLTPAPAYYAASQWTSAAQPRNGIFYQGGTAPNGIPCSASATSYEVKDIDGNIVSSGALSSVTTMTPAVPGGGWLCGWYRVFFYQGTLDALFGYSCGATNFVVKPADAHFMTTPAANVNGGGFGNPGWLDVIANGVMGVGVPRFSIDNANAPTTGQNTIALVQAAAASATTYWINPSVGADAARPRAMWCAFPNGAYDVLSLTGSYLRVYCKTGAVDGSTTFVEVTGAAGKACTIKVYSPTSLAPDLKETWNVTTSIDAVSQIAASNYIRVFSPDAAGNTNATNQAATAIGRSYYTGVGTAVAGLVPSGVLRFEGPRNEPDNAGFLGAEVAQQMLLFQAAVRAGDPSALALGPCTVNIGPSATASPGLGFWRAFLAAGGGNYCDELSFHAYNAMTNGDVNYARSTLQAFFALIAAYNLSSKPCWQTESTQVITAVYSVHHPRRARLQTFEKLLLEEAGVPKERNNPWYDQSHGFWAFPAWLENGDNSLQPQALSDFTLSAQAWGQTYQSRLVFPGLYDNVFAGWLYAGASKQTAVLLVTSYVPGATVTLSTSAAGPLTVVDWAGNTSSATVSGGQFTIGVRELPTYVQLPVGATCSVVTVNGRSSPAAVDVASYGGARVNGTTTPQVNAGTFLSNYAAQTGIYSGPAPPGNIDIIWNGTASLRRLMIWCGSFWQSDSAFGAFTVSTSTDGGSSFTQRRLVDVTSGFTAVQFGTNSLNVGCEYETFCPEQWWFEVDFGGLIDCNAIRVTVTATSYGGEPTLDCVNAGGQGNNVQQIVLQRIAALGTFTPASSGGGGSGGPGGPVDYGFNVSFTG